MKHTILPLAIIATAILASCNNDSGPGTTSKPANFTFPTTTEPQQPGQFATNITTSPGTTTLPVQSVPTTTQTLTPGVTTQPVQIAPTTQTVTPVATTATRAGINPAHGQPGHRCDIAVGAPLDSKAATAAATTNTSNSTPVNIALPTNATPTNTSATNASTSKAGINPAHGQPGHRCDIPVGAPLDSKPTTPAVTNTATTNTGATTTSIPQYTPIIPAKTDAVTAPGMNPEHGKPGHRCDIAVGAPLDSKPTIVTEKEKTATTEKKD